MAYNSYSINQNDMANVKIHGLMSDASLTVTPEIMHMKSETVLANIQKMQNEFDNIQNAVNKTNGYWVGEAGDQFRKKYIERQPEIQEMLRRLMEHVKELHQMANVYLETENDVKEVAESLPADVIF